MSTLKVNTLQNTSAAHSSTPEQIAQGRAKCWFSYDGAGESINDSFGISSISDGGTGRFQVNFSTSFSNTNYCYTTGHTPASNNDTNIILMHQANGGTVGTSMTAKTASAIGFITIRASDNTGQDTDDSSAAFFGDQ